MACFALSETPRSCLVQHHTDRQALAKVTKEGLFIEELERNPGKYLPDVTADKLSAEVVKVRLDLVVLEWVKCACRCTGCRGTLEPFFQLSAVYLFGARGKLALALGAQLRPRPTRTSLTRLTWPSRCRRSGSSCPSTPCAPG